MQWAKWISSCFILDISKPY